VRKEYLAKINNLPNHHGAGPPEARGPMQSHRLHRLKAGPDHYPVLFKIIVCSKCKVSNHGWMQSSRRYSVHACCFRLSTALLSVLQPVFSSSLRLCLSPRFIV